MFARNEEVESYVASGDLSLCLGRIVEFLGTAGIVKVGIAMAAAPTKHCGVLANAPKDGEHASVVFEGVTMVRVGAAVNAGDLITSADSGWGITATNQVASGAPKSYIGRAQTDAASGMLAAVDVDFGFMPNSY